MRSNCRPLALLGATTLLACEIENVEVPRPPAQLSIHAVLSATAATQVVLLERTRNGSVFQIAPGFDLEDPVLSDEGIAEPGATATMVTPSGRTLIAVEDRVVRQGKGKGIYRFALSGDSLERGGVYRLTVASTQGEVLTAETSVPQGSAIAVAEQRVFDRSSDSIVLQWPATAGARSYLVRVETPFGPRSFFTDSTRVRLDGELRNVEVEGLPRVFLPGFQQAITVSAVDSNYFDWYRTHNDPVSGSGLLNRVRGGVGVFGSLVRLRFQDVHVVAPQNDPESGLWVFEGTNFERSITPYLSLTLYVESRSRRSDQADALSGRYQARPRFGDPCLSVNGVLGSAKGGKIDVAFLCSWFARDTVEMLSGEMRGDTIVGRYRGLGGQARFVRQR